MHRSLAIAIGLALVVTAACTKEGAATRARDAADRIRSQIKDVQAEALAQAVSPETVREAQQHLQVLREYLGEVNGKLDMVTVNAVQAFQTAQGMEADGLITDRTMERLRQAAAEKQAASGSG
jgi:peptidoglycan hydrolase-like protein with peptidoglycan-binding domain